MALGQFGSLIWPMLAVMSRGFWVDVASIAVTIALCIVLRWAERRFDHRRQPEPPQLTEARAIELAAKSKRSK
jgi:hypothetical protein